MRTGDTQTAVLQWDLYIEIQQAVPVNTSPHRFEASFTVATGDGLVSATAVGEAIYSHGLWLIRGKTTQSIVNGVRNGGFWLDLYTARISEEGDRAVWRFDLFG